MRPPSSHTELFQVTVSPRPAASDLGDLEILLKQWQRQAHDERQRQRRKFIGNVESRSAKFPAYLDPSSNVSRSPSKPLGSFASLTPGGCWDSAF